VRFLPGLILLVFGFYGASAFGEEIPAGAPPLPVLDNIMPAPDNVLWASDNVLRAPDNVMPAKGAISAKEGYVDRSHSFFDRRINNVVTWFDGLFGATARHDARKADIKLQWSHELRAEEGESVRYHTAIRAQLHLPRFEKKLRLVIMEETREEAVAPIPSDAGTPVVNTPTKANTLRAIHTELRFYARDTKAGYAFLAVGSRFVWLPEMFVRARLLWRHTLADNSFISPSVTPFWQDHLGFGITPQLDFGRPFPHRYIFLWANSATVFHNRDGFLWGTEASLSRIMSSVSAIAFAVGANGATRPSLVADRFNLATNNYKVSVKYRRKIYRPWLFLELVPEANWRRDETGGRDVIPAFTVRMEINSEGPRALLPVPVIVQEQLPVPGLHYEPIVR